MPLLQRPKDRSVAVFCAGSSSPLCSRGLSFAESTKVGLPTVALAETGDRPAFAASQLRRATSALTGERRLVDQNSASWNQMSSWLKRVQALRTAA